MYALKIDVLHGKAGQERLRARRKGRNVQMVRGQARKAPLRHHGIAAFKMAGEPLGIEQREQEAVPAQTFTEGLEAVGVMGQRHGKLSHFLHGAGDALVKADGVEQARGDA